MTKTLKIILLAAVQLFAAARDAQEQAQQRIEILEGRLHNAESALAQLAIGQLGVADEFHRIQQIERRLAAIEARTSTQPQTQEQAELNTQSTQQTGRNEEQSGQISELTNTELTNIALERISVDNRLRIEIGELRLENSELRLENSELRRELTLGLNRLDTRLEGINESVSTFVINIVSQSLPRPNREPATQQPFVAFTGESYTLT